MFMLTSTPRDPNLESVWDGSMRGTYLAALRDVFGKPLDPFVAKPAEVPPEPDVCISKVGKVIELMKADPGPWEVSQIASRLHFSGSTAADALSELCEIGIVQRLQPTMFEMDPQRGELYTLR